MLKCLTLATKMATFQRNSVILKRADTKSSLPIVSPANQSQCLLSSAPHTHRIQMAPITYVSVPHCTLQNTDTFTSSSESNTEGLKRISGTKEDLMMKKVI
jgi:hypothetical protein